MEKNVYQQIYDIHNTTTVYRTRCVMDMTVFFTQKTSFWPFSEVCASFPTFGMNFVRPTCCCFEGDAIFLNDTLYLQGCTLYCKVFALLGWSGQHATQYWNDIWFAMTRYLVCIGTTWFVLAVGAWSAFDCYVLRGLLLVRICIRQFIQKPTTPQLSTRYSNNTTFPTSSTTPPRMIGDKMVYCGLEGWMHPLRHVMRYNDLGHPLCASQGLDLVNGLHSRLMQCASLALLK